MVQKFNRKYFNVLVWAGDKYVNGIYADTTLHPDLLMELQLKRGKSLFYVECKWRKDFNGGSVQFAGEAQLERYKQFEKEKNIPVFIALGIGGKATNPEFIYTSPVSLLNSNSMTKADLHPYQKDISKGFYYYAKGKVLK